MKGVAAPQRVDVKVAPGAEGAHAEASELGFLGLAKIVEYAAEGSLAERPGAVLEIGAERASGESGGIKVRVRGFRKTVSDDDIRVMLLPPGEQATGETRWRSGVKLALASAIAQAKGWKLQAVREGDGVVFEVRVPEAGAQGPERKSEPARTHGAADAPDQS